MRRFIPFLFALAACAPSEDKFEAETIAITCEKTFECTSEEAIAEAQEMGFWFLGEDASECEEILNSDSAEDTAASDWVYNKEYAKECLSAMEAMSCEDFTGGLPEACENVYSEE